MTLRVREWATILVDNLTNSRLGIMPGTAECMGVCLQDPVVDEHCVEAVGAVTRY
jgi:hypothetical protein